MGEWDKFGYKRSEIEILENFDGSDDWEEQEELLLIEANRRAYHDAFYAYMRENGVDFGCYY